MEIRQKKRQQENQYIDVSRIHTDNEDSTPIGYVP